MNKLILKKKRKLLESKLSENILKTYEESIVKLNKHKLHNISTNTHEFYTRNHQTLLKCKYCLNNNQVVIDNESGSMICKSCGVILVQECFKDTFYGTGISQYESFDINTIDPLDKFLGTKFAKDTTTTRYYKNILYKKACDKIDCLVNDFNTAKKAKELFQAFSEAHERVNSFDNIVKTCVALAQEPSNTFKIEKPLEFNCKKCGLTFNMKKSVRLHDCNPEKNKRIQQPSNNKLHCLSSSSKKQKRETATAIITPAPLPSCNISNKVIKPKKCIKKKINKKQVHHGTDQHVKKFVEHFQKNINLHEIHDNDDPWS